MRRMVFTLGIGLLLLAGVLGGGNAFGRVALGLGAPNLAASIFASPYWRGVALYRAGRFAEATETFEDAGPDAAFNRGNAQVKSERYAAALEAYDLAQAYQTDTQAQVNFDIVLAFYAGTRIDADSIARWGEEKQGETAAAEVARGSARASGTGDEVTNTGATIGLTELQSRELRRVRKVFDDKFVVASPRWLATLEDVPGAYLAARVSHEYKRRLKAGEGQPPMEEDW